MRGLLKLLLRGCAGLLGIALKVIIEAATQLRWIVRIIGIFFRIIGTFCITSAILSYMHFEFIDFITGVKGYELIFMVAGLMIMCFGMFLYWIQDTGAITLYMFSERCIDYCLQRYIWKIWYYSNEKLKNI